MKSKPNITIILSLVVGMLLTISSQISLMNGGGVNARFIGYIGIGLIVMAIVLMFLPTKKK